MTAATFVLEDEPYRQQWFRERMGRLRRSLRQDGLAGWSGRDRGTGAAAGVVGEGGQAMSPSDEAEVRDASDSLGDGQARLRFADMASAGLHDYYAGVEAMLGEYTSVEAMQAGDKDHLVLMCPVSGSLQGIVMAHVLVDVSDKQSPKVLGSCHMRMPHTEEAATYARLEAWVQACLDDIRSEDKP